MNSKLAPEDITLASKYLKRYQRTAKKWKWFRWYLLLMAIIMLSVSYYFFTLANSVHDKNTSEYILGGRNLDTQILGRYIDARIELERLETAFIIKMIFPMIFGSALLGLVIGLWKLHERCKVIAMGLRTLISINQLGDKASNEF